MSLRAAVLGACAAAAALAVACAGSVAPVEPVGPRVSASGPVPASSPPSAAPSGAPSGGPPGTPSSGSAPGQPSPRRGRECVAPVLQGHPLVLAPYDAATGRAGDVQFVSRTQFNRVFTEFGFVIPADQTSSGAPKPNPQPTYHAPLGTAVLSPVDGVVDRISDLWSTPTLGDVSVMILPDGLEPGCYVAVELEHVVNVAVTEGQRVTTGQAIAEVGPLNSQGNSGLGLVELGILTGSVNGRPLHVCPYAFFAPSAAAEMAALVRFMADWEAHIGDASLYDESAWADGVPGCSAGDLEE